MDLIEFGRIIHAEMSAISDAARLGKATKGSTLYCTTFPCHICAKHIVASGIDEVLYVEPYPKSYAEQLHKDAISLGAEEARSEKTRFRPFIGISPFRFRDLFEITRRKNQSGDFVEWRDQRPKPIVKYTVANWLPNELALFTLFEKKIADLISNQLVTINKVGLAVDAS